MRTTIRALGRATSTAILTVSLYLAAGNARADDAVDAARAAYKEATAAVQAGELAKGLSLFEEAASKAPHPATHLAAGRTAATLGDKARAADHFARALQLGLVGSEADEARKKLAEVSADLGKVRVTGTGGTARLDGGARLSTPAILHGSQGPHAIMLTKGDRQHAITVELTRGAEQTIALDDALAPKTNEPAPTPEPTPAPEPETVSSFPNTLTWVGVTGLVLGGLGGGATAGVGVAALSAKDEFLETRTREDYDAAIALETGTNISLGLSIGLAVIGASLLVGSVFLEEERSPVAFTGDGLLVRFD
jgi:hypothetical protein